MITLVPPTTFSEFGATLVTVGAATFVKWSALDVGDVPPGVVTVTSTVPALPGGAVAVICVAPFTVKVVAGIVPNLTAVAPERAVPVIVTLVPPAAGPEAGLTPVTVGPAV
jgi:hypothetical protein